MGLDVAATQGALLMGDVRTLLFAGRFAVLGATVVALAACGDLSEPARKEAPAVVWRAAPGLPAPVTNNAVAAVETAHAAGVGIGRKLGRLVTSAVHVLRQGQDVFRHGISPILEPTQDAMLQ